MNVGGLFETIVNGIAFLIFFSACSLLVYRKMINFCTLIFISCYVAESVYQI
jgi:hypothetical protein